MTTIRRDNLQLEGIEDLHLVEVGQNDDGIVAQPRDCDNLRLNVVLAQVLWAHEREREREEKREEKRREEKREEKREENRIEYNTIEERELA
jgi:hypothetical protein